MRGPWPVTLLSLAIFYLCGMVGYIRLISWEMHHRMILAMDRA